MSGSTKAAPKEQFVKLSRELLSSDAWRSLGINGRRFLDVLMREHMRQGGRHNGKLKAPRLQLVEYGGIGARYVSDAIAEVETLGLVDVHRGGMRVATTYALTWLPLHDGTPPSNRWQSYRNPALKELPMPKSKNLTDKGKSGLTDKGKSDAPNLTDKGKSDCPETLVSQGKHPSRISSYQGGGVNTDLSVERRRAAGGAL